ncbi:MAG: hypothetical protein J5814_01050 [Bacteroidaceae bacterium]|nr:hypothetical protein [Bacteroidaceae bacterium]
MGWLKEEGKKTCPRRAISSETEGWYRGKRVERLVRQTGNIAQKVLKKVIFANEK